MAPIWILVVLIDKIYAAGAAEIYQNLSFVSARLGEAVTLHCTLADQHRDEDVFWYKQPMGKKPQELGIKGTRMDPIFFSHFQNSDFRLERVSSNIALTLPNPTKEDEGTYYCGVSVMKMIRFSTGTFLSVTGHPKLNILVSQSPASGSVSPGESVTLQCNVLSEIRAELIRVLWFRAAGQSSPEILYNHQNSRECKISSSINSCVNTFSKNINDDNDTGIYYCAAAACGKIVFGNGTTVGMNHDSLDRSALLVFLGLGLCLCVIWNITLCFCCVRWNNCEKCREIKTPSDPHHLSVEDQDQDPVDLHYAALHLTKKKTKTGQKTRGRPQNSVYAEVSYSSQT